MYSLTTILLACTFVLVFAPTNGHAFGAGDVPDFSYLNDKAFRHGDIENILENLAKSVGSAASGGGLLGLASSVLSAAKGGEKFGRLDIKRVYFGNWLRDYSQAMDIAGLSKLSADTLVMVVSILGFMTFGFATEEFEVTGDRLSVYLPVEHIDNPKGYSEKEGDARQFHPKLRPPVDPRELEIDERTGMKNYMATENEGWDTSTAHIRRTFEACIEHGRRAQGREGDDLWEAYRLLGTGLHTLEDLLAHSNWCELALRKMGHSEVFCHVGDDVLVDTPNGRAPPLVTGTFGSADFIHSLMGEATDHISEASVTNLYDKMKQARDSIVIKFFLTLMQQLQSGDADSSIEGLKTILSKLPIGGGSDKAEQAEDIKQKAFDFNPDNYAPKEVQEQLLQTLKWRDDVYRDIIKKIEMVPGLNDLIDELTNALNAYIYTVLAPWLTPIMQQVTGALGEGSKAVIDSDDQYEVFTNSNASDPSHSILSKDHFSLILNEPAGKIAKIVVEMTVNLIVQAWFSNDDPGRIIDEILEAFHHPYYASGNSRIQNAMMDQMERWFGGLGDSEGRETIQALTKESVREGKNHRLGDAGTSDESGAQPTSSHRPQTQGSSYGSQQSQDEYSSGGYGGYQGVAQSTTNTSSYQRQVDDGDRDDRHGRGGQSLGGRQNESEYSSGIQSYARRDDGESYRPQDSYGGGRQTQSGYEYSSRRDDYSYGQRQESYGGRQEYGRETGRSDDNYAGSGRYGGIVNDSYERESRPEMPSYESPDDSYSRRDEGREGHGGHGGHGHYGPRHHRQEEFQSEGYQPSYDRPERGGVEYERGGYDGGERGGGYGGGDGDGGRGAAGGFGGFGGQPTRRDEGFGGYGNDETFGAERLNLEDGDGEEGYGYGGGRGRSREDY